MIAECGRTEQRRRSLPARSMAYFAMGMAMHSDGSYEDVLALISDGLAWAERDDDRSRLANKAAISHARDRLGAEPMTLLFARVARPLAAKDTPGSWLAGRRLVAIDGTCLDLADTPANDDYFGRPGVMKGERAAFPQARVVALAECGTHAMFDAVIGAVHDGGERPRGRAGRPAAAGDAVSRRSRVLQLRGVAERQLNRGGPAVAGRRTTSSLDPVKNSPDGSWLAEVFHSTQDRQRQRPATVRVIEYTVDDGREPVGPIRLITTIARSPQGARDRAAPRLHPALGDRDRVRRAQDPPARATSGAALQVTRARHPGDLGPPVLPLRDPHPDVRRRRPRRPRPRPGQLRRRTADLTPLDRPTGRLSPLRPLTPPNGSGATPSAS